MLNTESRKVVPFPPKETPSDDGVSRQLLAALEGDVVGGAMLVVKDEGHSYDIVVNGICKDMPMVTARYLLTEVESLLSLMSEEERWAIIARMQQVAISACADDKTERKSNVLVFHGA